MKIIDHIDEIREDFPILKREMNGYPVDYLDNSATTLKPKAMIDEVVRYYTYLGANAHRGDYEMSAQVDYAYEGARKTTAEFINAARKEEIVFTSGTTESLNLLAMMITNQLLHEEMWFFLQKPSMPQAFCPGSRLVMIKSQCELYSLNKRGKTDH